MGFLNQYGLSDEFKLNVECNHATLAGHSCEHELQVHHSTNCSLLHSPSPGSTLIEACSKSAYS